MLLIIIGSQRREQIYLGYNHFKYELEVVKVI